MTSRDRALFATSALLYTGPLYAGLAGHGLEFVPLFAAIFMIWLSVVRPGDWPRDARQWRSPRAIAWPLQIFAVQLVLAGFCLAIGRGIGGLFDFTPPLPLAFTILVSIVSIALAKLLRDDALNGPRRAEGLGIGSGILDVRRPRMPGEPPGRLAAEAAMAHLAEVPRRGVHAAALRPLLDEVEAEGAALDLLDALATAPARHLPYVQAEVLLALRPATARRILGTGRIAAAFERALATRRGRVLLGAADAASVLLRTEPRAAGELPDQSRLRSEAAALSADNPAAAQALRELASALEDMRIL